MFKKTVSIFLALGMIVCLSACGNEKTPSKPSENQVSTEQSSVEAQEQSSVEETTNNTETSTVTSTAQPTNSQITNNKPTANSQPKPSHTHSYSNATCKSPKKCSCGATAGTALGHSFANATCTSPKICSRCGETSGSALGHSYSNATCTSPKTCSRCGNTNGSALGHNYVNNKCSRCGKIDPESLPVGLDTVYVFDSGYKYDYSDGTVTDAFGNSYVGYHYFNRWGNATDFALFNLDSKYSKFSCDMITKDNNAVFSIYVDNVLKYQSTNLSKYSKPIHAEIDVKNANQMKIMFSSDGSYQEGFLVNAQLTK